MHNPIEDLEECRRLLFNALKEEIVEITIDKVIYQLKITFTTGTTLFIRYNEFGEYGYQLIFSKKKDDYIRFDNFDDRWPVKTRPHHYHTRFKASVIESPMKGIPTMDMPELIKIFKKLLF